MRVPAATYPFHWYELIARLSVVRVFLLTFLITGVGSAIIAVAEGRFWGSDPGIRYWIGPFFVWPVSCYLLMPITIPLIYLLYRQMGEAIGKGVRDGVIVPTSEEQALPYMRVVRSKWKLLLLAAFVASITAYARYKWMSGFTGLPTWELTAELKPSYLFFFSAGLVMLGLFLVVNAAVDFILWTLLIYSISRRERGISLKPNPFHPDGSAGLAGFGKAALTSYFVVLLIAIFIVVQLAEKIHVNPQACAISVLLSMKENFWICFAEISRLFPAVVMSLVAATVFLPIAFFAPLVPLRAKIVECKRAVIEAAWTDAVENLKAARASGTFTAAVPYYRDLVDTVRIYAFVEGVSDWPFGRKFAIAVVLTSLPAIFSAAKQLFGLIPL